MFEYISGFLDRNGYHPSYQQIARQLGVSSKGGIQRHIIALENQGLLERRRENGSFGIEIRSKRVETESVCSVEMLGGHGTGDALSAVGGPVIAVPRFLIGSLSPDNIFVVRMTDDSMVEKQLCEDDIVLFERRSYARRGEIVAAYCEGSGLVIRRYFHKGVEIELRPAAEDLEPQVFPADEVSIIGVYRGLMRPALPA